MTGLVEPVAWQHRVFFPDTRKWSGWRDGKHDALLDNDYEERPLVLLSQLQAAEAERDASGLECRNYMRLFDIVQARAEAAEAEVSKLKAQVETARVALQPFATSYMAGVIDTVPDLADVKLSAHFGADLELEDYLAVGEFRAAAQALRALSDEVNDGQ